VILRNPQCQSKCEFSDPSPHPVNRGCASKLAPSWSEIRWETSLMPDIRAATRRKGLTTSLQVFFAVAIAIGVAVAIVKVPHRLTGYWLLGPYGAIFVNTPPSPPALK
jgi:hypothetical protein